MSVLNSIINSLFKVDVSAIYNQDSGEQIFSGASIIKSSVIRDSKFMEHPLETGAIIVDHRIILPNEVRMQLIVAGKDFPNVYQRIAQAWENADKLDLKLKVGFFSDMVIKAMPHEETSDMMNAVTIDLKLRQVQLASKVVTFLKKDNVANKKQASTSAGGEKNPVKSQSILARAFG